MKLLQGLTPCDILVFSANKYNCESFVLEIVAFLTGTSEHDSNKLLNIFLMLHAAKGSIR